LAGRFPGSSLFSSLRCGPTMGVQAMVKAALNQIRKNNTTNPRVALKWNNRVTKIAEDIEISQDTTK
jgi:uncharacterized protein YkwD